MTNDKRLLLPWRFLLSHRHAARAFASARVGVGALAANREAATVAQSAIAANVHQALDVHLHLLTKVAFYHTLLVNDRANSVDLIFCKLAYALINADARFSEYL